MCIRDSPLSARAALNQVRSAADLPAGSKIFQINLLPQLHLRQLIFERRNGESFDFEANNLPISYEKGETGNVPTQNLVDAFQLTNGCLLYTSRCV